MARVEIVDGLDQPDAADLKEVVRVFAAACKALNDAEHQPEIAVNQLVARGLIAVPAAVQQLAHLVVPERLQFRGVHAADLDLALGISVHKNQPPNKKFVRR